MNKETFSPTIYFIWEQISSNISLVKHSGGRLGFSDSVETGILAIEVDDEEWLKFWLPWAAMKGYGRSSLVDGFETVIFWVFMSTIELRASLASSNPSEKGSEDFVAETTIRNNE